MDALRRTPETRDLDASIVDRIRRDAALLLFAPIGQLTRRAPPDERRVIGQALSVH
jgi:hypothetical protein